MSKVDNNRQAIWWSVADFEGRAEDKWTHTTRPIDNGATCWQDVYDETKFEEALTQMIHKHDCNYGITWGTVDFFLDEYCLKPTYHGKED